MKIIECEQGSPEWHAARCGKVTASRIADVTARIKTGYGASRANYMAELLVERLTGQVADGYVSAEMKWGTDTEPQARTVYELINGVTVVRVGLVLHPSIDMAAASPDSLVSDDGLLEIKCPNTATHINTLLSETVPDKYVKQIQWQMACTGRQWCDYVSYDPRMPGDMQLFQRRIMRDDVMIADITGEVVKFLAELDDMMRKLTVKYRAEAA